MKAATRNNVFLWFARERRFKKDKSEEDGACAAIGPAPRIR